MVRFSQKAAYNGQQTKKNRKVYSGFYISAYKLVIELDGSQHGEPENRIKDEERDAVLDAFGIKVLRYTNEDVNKNFDGVCRDIMKHIERRGGVNIYRAK